MMRVTRPVFDSTAGAVIVSELAMPETAVLARDAARLHEAERELARGFPAVARKDAFLAGRLALHAALAEHGDARAHRMPVLRDARGRPQASWAPAPAFSIAHTKVRAVAAVATGPGVRALGIDVEECAPSRAEALLRMAIAGTERELIARADGRLVEGPIALWCAREACVKAFAIEVGWFGTALVASRFEEAEPIVDDAERAYEVTLRFESNPPMRAHAWVSNGAVYAVAARRGDA
jgi:4'-phosphopantetheinyl transferase EntD